MGTYLGNDFISDDQIAAHKRLIKEMRADLKEAQAAEAEARDMLASLERDRPRHHTALDHWRDQVLARWQRAVTLRENIDYLCSFPF